LSGEVYQELKRKIDKLKKKPKLVVVLVGENEASRIYIKQKQKAASEIGIDFELIEKPESSAQEELEGLIESLNSDASVTGVVIQRPLPDQIDPDEVDLLVAPEKDVDGLNPISDFLPATTVGVFQLLAAYKIDPKGKKVVVVGRSKLIGLPTALEFLERGATVTVCHSGTAALANETKQADILVSAVGKPGLIKKEMIKKGAVVIDIGISRQAGKVVGDVDFDEVSQVATFISPVPGGVGPMTVAGLMENLARAFEKQINP
jgi:methylenetetrahydrofolate dehydrogenase (NADP+)/methenyltetrahydrofolate cyclohydrolase